MYRKTKGKISEHMVSTDSIHRAPNMSNNQKSAANTLRSLSIVMIVTIGIPKTFLAVMYGIILSEQRSIRNGLKLDNFPIKLAFIFANNIIYFRNSVSVFIYFKYVKTFRIFINSFFGRISKITNWLFKRTKFFLFQIGQNISAQYKKLIWKLLFFLRIWFWMFTWHW